MVYAPQRRHAASSLTLVLHTTAFVQYLYSPNFLILLSRALIQQQIIATPIVHPRRSLFALGFMLTSMNSVAAFLHWLDFLAGLNGSKGIILDFVGQSVPASMTRILLLDLVLYLGQLVTLVLVFLTGHARNIPYSDSFPYRDLLLPPEPAQYKTLSTAKDDDDEQEDDDVESGLKQRRRRGFQSAFEELDTEESLWLNDDDRPGEESNGRSRSNSSPGSRQREPPLVFSLTLPHIFHLILSLPNPLPPVQAFAGGTPNPTPPVTPGVETTSPLFRASTLAPDTTADHTNGTRGRSDTVSSVDEGESTRPIPGDFRRTERTSGNGV